jgi:outer membrane protein assembly factor BamB
VPAPGGSRSARRSAAVGALVALALSASAVAGCSGGSDEGAATTVPAVPAPSRELAEHGTDWVLPGRDHDNSRATTDSRIDTTTVRDLEQVWEVEMSGPLSTVPIIVGDTVYAQDGRGLIVAVDRATGTPRWRSEGHGFNIGPFGVAVADGRVFGVEGSEGVVALDAATGEQLWTTSLAATPTTGIDIQPTVYDGIVLVSTVPVSIGGIYTPGDRGVISALDAATGEVLWSFDTVEGDDLWGHPEVNSGGGAWYPPAVDPAARVVYWGIANPAPFPGTAEWPNGTSRPGDNLYTDSAVALDLDTGELLWFHQVHPHDLFDRDLVHTLIARVDGRAVTVATGKGGVVVGLDPTSGEQLWRTPVGMHDNDELTELDGPTDVLPGTFGGVLTPPATADGIVYVAVLNAPTTLEPDQKAYIGSQLGTNDGQVVAIDAATGEIVWDATVEGDPLGGIAVVNDLVLTATLDGTIVGLDRERGRPAFRREAPGGINGWMSIAGDLVVVPVGNADPPRLVAYALP